MSRGFRYHRRSLLFFSFLLFFPFFLWLSLSLSSQWSSEKIIDTFLYFNAAKRAGEGFWKVSYVYENRAQCSFIERVCLFMKEAEKMALALLLLLLLLLRGAADAENKVNFNQSWVEGFERGLIWSSKRKILKRISHTDGRNQKRQNRGEMDGRMEKMLSLLSLLLLLLASSFFISFFFSYSSTSQETQWKCHRAQKCHRECVRAWVARRKLCVSSQFDLNDDHKMGDEG